jgi:ADP-ribose pyrophosphatase YjhB (NUDIX family)
MKKRRKPSRWPLFAAGVIERFDNDVLICLPRRPEGADRLWEFPRGLAREDESPEAAMRRFAREVLGIEVEIVVGQPPLVEQAEGREIELRYFFCGILNGAVRADAYQEIRWVPKAHLREYEFDEASAPVAAWLVEHGW